ncbi:hypothetical protein Bbelb_040840 [Branchiostoma belcheri]|nr:hypothetical protein Bbelb_040840 [Branchiostoma belcheri]
MGVDKDDIETRKAILKHRKSANLQITLLPYGSQKDICKEMMQAHLVLMPSRAEPFGLVGLEAIAAGVPVLVSSKSGLADFIHEHVDELHHSIVDMDDHEEGVTVKYLARSIEKMLKQNRTEFETAARCKKKLLSSKYWEESHEQFVKALPNVGHFAAGNVAQQPAQIQTRKRGTDTIWENVGGRKRTKRDIPPPLPIVVEILAQVKPTVKTPKELLSYASAKKAFVTLDITTFTDETLGLLEQVKPEIRTVEDLLDTAEAIKQLEEIKGVNVTEVKKGSLVFYTQCTDLGGLGQLWFMYKSGKLNDLLVGSLIRKETLQQLCAENVSVKSTINVEDFRKALIYILTSPATEGKGPLMPRLPLEYPLYQPHTHTTSRVLDVLHLDQKLPEVCGEQHDMPLPSHRDDGDDDLPEKLGNLQIAGAVGATSMEELCRAPPWRLLVQPSAIPPQSSATKQVNSLVVVTVERLSQTNKTSQSSMELLGQPYNVVPSVIKQTELRDKTKALPNKQDFAELHGGARAARFGSVVIKHAQSSATKQVNSLVVVTSSKRSKKISTVTRQPTNLTCFDAELFMLYITDGARAAPEVKDLKAKLSNDDNQRIDLFCRRALCVLHDHGTKASCASTSMELCEVLFVWESLWELGLSEQLHGALRSLVCLREPLSSSMEVARAAPHLSVLYLFLCVGHNTSNSCLSPMSSTPEETPEDTEVGEINSVLKPAGASVIPAQETTEDQTIGDTEVPQVKSELVSLDIKELERLMGPRIKRTSSISSDSSGYVTGTPGSGLSRPDSPTGEGDVQGTLETLLAELNKPTVLRDKGKQFDLYCQIGDLNRTKLRNPQSALQYYQNMLECSQALSEDAKQAKAYSRLGVTCDILGLQDEAFTNHEKALAIYRVDAGNETDVCIAYKNLASSLALSGQVSDAKTNYESALAVAMETGNKTEQMDIYCMLGDLHREQLKEPEVSHMYYTEVLALARDLGRKDAEMAAYNRLGACSDKQNNDAALEWHQKSLEMSKVDGNKRVQITTYANVGTVYRLLGKLDLATSHFNTALQLAQQIGDQYGQMKVYFEIGEMHEQQLHSPSTAIQYYEQALVLARQLKDRHSEGLACNRLGLVHWEMEEYESALEWFQRYLQISQEDGNKERTAAHTNVGNAYSLLGKLDLATFHFDTALQLAEQTGDQHGQMEIYFKMGDMHREQLHSPRTAIQHYEQALALARQLKDRQEEGEACYRLGLVHCEVGEYEASLECFQKSLKIKQEDGEKKEQIETHTAIGTVYSLQGNPDLAASHLNTALQMAQQTGDQHGQMDVYFMMGDMHKNTLHSPREAIQYYDEALSLARQLKDKHHEGVACERLGMARFEMGEYEAGLRLLQKASKIREEEDGDKGAQGKPHSNVERAPMVQYLESHVASQNAEEQRKQMNASFQIGEMFREQLHSPRTAIQYYQQHLALARQLGDRHEEGLTYDRLGRAHFELKEYDKALYQSAMAIAIETADKLQQDDIRKRIDKL